MCLDVSRACVHYINIRGPSNDVMHDSQRSWNIFQHLRPNLRSPHTLDAPAAVNLLSVIFCKPRTSSGVMTALASRSSSVVTGTPTSVELQPFFTFIAAVCFGLPVLLLSVAPVSLPGLSPAGFLALDGSWLLPLLVQE